MQAVAVSTMRHNCSLGIRLHAADGEVFVLSGHLESGIYTRGETTFRNDKVRAALESIRDKKPSAIPR